MNKCSCKDVTRESIYDQSEYVERFDAHCCPTCRDWLEGPCPEGTCPWYCDMRPDKAPTSPSQ